MNKLLVPGRFASPGVTGRSTLRPCPYCAQPIGETEQKCPFCQAPLAAAPGVPAPGGIPPAASYTHPPETSGKAIGSLVSGILCFFLPASILAVVLGHLSMSEIRRSNGRLRGSGLALAGLILGYMGIAVIPLVLIIAAISIPNLLRARMAANEASAVASLRTLNTALLSYNQAYPGTIPATLSNLGPGTPPSADRADLIDESLALGHKNGYVFTYTSYSAVGSNGTAELGYSINADPFQENTSGRRHFFTDQTGVIRSSTGGPASVESPPVN